MIDRWRGQGYSVVSRDSMSGVLCPGYLHDEIEQVLDRLDLAAFADIDLPD
jgi:hypothetical protein